MNRQDQRYYRSVLEDLQNIAEDSCDNKHLSMQSPEENIQYIFIHWCFSSSLIHSAAATTTTTITTNTINFTVFCFFQKEISLFYIRSFLTIVHRLFTDINNKSRSFLLGFFAYRSVDYNFFLVRSGTIPAWLNIVSLSYVYDTFYDPCNHLLTLSQ